MLVGTAVCASGCSKDRPASASAAPDDSSSSAPAPQANCGHSACGSNFFLDAAPVGSCAVGATCSVAVKLVATGEFHINDDYPYKIKADDERGVEYLGTDPGGKNVFSKAASDWRKKDEKSGVMTVVFRASDPGSKTVGGTFKLSVCSGQTCQLEQQRVQASVAVR